MEIKKDTIYFYTIATLTLGIIFYTFLMINEKQVRIRTDLEKTTTLRKKYAEGKKGGNLSMER